LQRGGRKRRFVISRLPLGRGVRPTTSAYQLAEGYRLTGGWSWLGDARSRGRRRRCERGWHDQAGRKAHSYLEAPPACGRVWRVGPLQQIPASARAHELLGSALFLQEKREEGIAELEAAVRLDPRSPSACFTWDWPTPGRTRSGRARGLSNGLSHSTRATRMPAFS